MAVLKGGGGEIEAGRLQAEQSWGNMSYTVLKLFYINRIYSNFSFLHPRL